MDTLSVEVLIDIFACLPASTLPAVQLTCKTFAAASTNLLYEHGSAGNEMQALSLINTLETHSAIRPLVRSLQFAGCKAMNKQVLKVQLFSLLDHCPRLRSLDIHYSGNLTDKESAFFDRLANLPHITSFALRVSSGIASIGSLRSAISRWAPHLEMLKLQGFCQSDQDLNTASRTSIHLPKLKSLEIKDCFVRNHVFLQMFGQTEALRDLKLGLMEPNAPSEYVVHETFKNRLSKLRTLHVEQAWVGQEGGEFQLGLDLVTQCTVGRLESLELHGQIFRPALFKLPQMRQVKQLDLSWISAIDHGDLLRWLAQNNRICKLETLNTCFVGYEEDTNKADVEALKRLTGRINIAFADSAAYG